MQRVMMMPAFRLRRAVLPLSLMALLAGCAAQPAAPTVSQPVPLNALTIMPSDLQKAEQEAYNQGFEAGRRYQRKHDQQAASPAAPGAASPDAVSPDAVSPDAVSPDSASPDAALPDAPQDAQQQAAINGKTPGAASTPAPAVCPPAAANQPALTPLKPVPPGSSYTTSGPAQPLSQ